MIPLRVYRRSARTRFRRRRHKNHGLTGTSIANGPNGSFFHALGARGTMRMKRISYPMRVRTSTKLLVFLIAAAIVAAALVYPQLPERIASHWDINGEANGTMSRFWGTFLMPLIMIGLLALYAAIPRIDPLKANIEKFRRSYDLLWETLFLYMIYVHGLIIAWNLGQRFDMTTFMLPAVAVLYYVIGGILEHAERNWFVGIRTPWTLSSDVVWKKTHVLGAKLFKLSALVTFVSAFLGHAIAFAAIIGVAVLTSLTVIIYSYLEFRKLPRDGT